MTQCRAMCIEDRNDDKRIELLDQYSTCIGIECGGKRSILCRLLLSESVDDDVNVCSLRRRAVGCLA